MLRYYQLFMEITVSIQIIHNNQYEENMFGLFKKDPVAKLQKAYEAKMLEARDVQRSGDLRKYAVVIEEAEEILKKIEAAKAK